MERRLSELASLTALGMGDGMQAKGRSDARGSPAVIAVVANWVSGSSREKYRADWMNMAERLKYW